MGQIKLTNVKSWDECPLFMSVDQVCDFLGFGRSVVDKWFNDKTFPLISDGSKKVEKENLRIWLDMKYGNFVFKNKQEEILLNKIKELVNFKEVI